MYKKSKLKEEKEDMRWIKTETKSQTLSDTLPNAQLLECPWS